jgi:predicted MFS family arabinose efflux permease
MIEKSKIPHASSYRWVVLAVFIVVALMSQLLWLTFAPITSEISALYNVTAFDISLLSLVWPLVFVFTAIPVGIYIDKNGFKKSVGIGAIFLTVFSIVRIFSINLDYNFYLLLIAQTGAAISQPFIFGSITKLAGSWFPEEEQGVATGLGTIGLFLGMMIALAITPMIYLSLGLSKLLMIYAYFSIASFFFFYILAKEGPNQIKEEISSTFSFHEFLQLSKHKPFLILEFGFFVVVGGFTALMTWIEQILQSLHGIGINEAGLLGGLLIIGGIIGSIVIPAASDKLKKLKPFVLADLLIGTILLYVIGIIDNITILSIVFFITGFFLMSALPLVLELSTYFSGKGLEGQASSLLWFFSQVGSVVLIIIIEPIFSIWGSYYYSIVLIVILWFISFILFFGIEDKKRIEELKKD